ncbi:MAG: Yip1 family protein [Patescibacteria group bacterium]|nr:Yip1 family protein [Patescibacteria group bacterium]
MTNESNNDNFKNKLTKELKEKIQKSVNDSFEKNVRGKGGTENPRMREFERNVVGAVDDYRKNDTDAAEKYRESKYRAYNKELKKDEEKSREDYFRRMDDVSSNRFDVRPNSPEGLKSGLAADRARVQGSEARRAEAQKIKKEAIKETKKKIDKEIPKMKGAKAKIASKVLGAAVYSLAQKMEERANAGGAGAIIIILFTLFLAAITDFIDILGEIGATVLIVSIVGSAIGLIIGGLLWLFNLLCALTIIIFWMLVLGGGHKKYFWKRVIRTIIIVFFVEAIPYVDIFPFAVLMVCWNWYDFAKDKKKAKNDLKALESEFKKNRKIKTKYIKEYA